MEIEQYKIVPFSKICDHMSFQFILAHFAPMGRGYWICFRPCIV